MRYAKEVLATIAALAPFAAPSQTQTQVAPPWDAPTIMPIFSEVPKCYTTVNPDGQLEFGQQVSSKPIRLQILKETTDRFLCKISDRQGKDIERQYQGGLFFFRSPGIGTYWFILETETARKVYWLDDNGEDFSILEF